MLRAGLLESDGPALNQGRKTQNYRFLCWRELAVIPIYEPLGFPWLRPRAWLTFCFPHLQFRTLGTCREVKEVFFWGGLKILECRVHKSKAIGWSIWKAFEPFSSLAQLEGFACSRGEKDKKRRASQQVRQLRMKAEDAHVRYSWRLLGVWVWGKRIPGFSPGRRRLKSPINIRQSFESRWKGITPVLKLN